jgi:hypothetical protein
MVDQNLMTIFVAVTAVAVLIQMGILIGFYFLSSKLSRQAGQAIDVTRNVLAPLQVTVENLRMVTARIADFSGWWRRSA